MAGLLAPRGWVLSSALHRGDLRSSLEAVDRIVGGIGEELMVIPLLPWILGLFCHLKYFAKRLERVLIPAVLIVTIGLMFGRYVFLAPDWDRRYALATVVLTIFYIPAGLDVMTRVLNRIYTFKGRLAVFGAERRPPWFYILILGGIVLCTPKLIFRPLRAEKAGYLAAAKWLHRNTAAEAMIAVPDPRITFYADRRGFFYRSYLDSRRADYVVEIVGDDAGQPPEGWTREYSTDVGPGVNKTVIIYSTPRAKR